MGRVRLDHLGGVSTSSGTSGSAATWSSAAPGAAARRSSCAATSTPTSSTEAGVDRRHVPTSEHETADEPRSTCCDRSQHRARRVRALRPRSTNGCASCRVDLGDTLADAPIESHRVAAHRDRSRSPTEVATRSKRMYSRICDRRRRRRSTTPHPRAQRRASTRFRARMGIDEPIERSRRARRSGGARRRRPAARTREVARPEPATHAPLHAACPDAGRRTSSSSSSSTTCAARRPARCTRCHARTSAASRTSTTR